MEREFLNADQIDKLSSFCLELFKKFGDSPMGKLKSDNFKGKIKYKLKYDGDDYSTSKLKDSQRYLIQDWLDTRIYFHINKVDEELILLEMSVLLNSSYNIEKGDNTNSAYLLGITREEIQIKMTSEIKFLTVCHSDKIYLYEK